MPDFKKNFAVGCSRDVINEGIEKLGLELSEVMELCIKGMQEHKAELGM
ncbi:MAG: hypothetical protein ACI4P9_02105 [Selenomonadaceae bacterium]